MEPRTHYRETTPTQNDHSIVNLLRELRDETTTLFQQEVDLVRTEMSEKLSKITRNLVTMAIGGGLAMVGLSSFSLG